VLLVAFVLFQNRLNLNTWRIQWNSIDFEF